MNKENLERIKNYCALSMSGLLERRSLYEEIIRDVPLLVAEVERLREQLWVGQGVHNAACDDLMRTRGDLSAAQKRIEELEKQLKINIIPHSE